MESVTVQATRTRVRIRLQEAILDGALAPSKAVQIAPTAALLGVSPTPVREALIQLETEGFLDAAPNRGFFVRPLEPDEVRNLYPLIWALEQMAVREVVPGARILDHLSEINRRLAEPGLNAREAVDLDTQWHAALVSKDLNTVRKDILEQLKAKAQRYELAYMRGTGKIERSVEEHDRIEAALRAGDLSAALEGLEANWKAGPGYLLPWLDTLPSPERTS